MIHDDAMPYKPPLNIPEPEQPEQPEPGGTDDSVGWSPEGSARLRAATATWRRRGYRVRYRDAFLIQLLRRRRTGLHSAPYVALTVAALALAVAAWIAALRRRPWHVITLTIGPDNRILTHSHVSARPPAP